MAKSPIAADKIKLDELDDAVPPKTECWASSILKLSDDKLVPFDISAKTKTGQPITVRIINIDRNFFTKISIPKIKTTSYTLAVLKV